MYRSLLKEYVAFILNEHINDFTMNIESMLKQHGIVIGKPLGCGLHGYAFEIDDDKAIKVSIAKNFTIATETVARLKTLQKVQSDAFAMIYDAGVLEHVHLNDERWVNKDGVAFYYVMERLFKLNKEDATLARRLLNQLIADPRQAKKTLFVAKRIFQRDGDDVSIVDRVERLFTSIINDNVIHRDINAGALMSNLAGDYKLIDLESARAL